MVCRTNDRLHVPERVRRTKMLMRISSTQLAGKFKYAETESSRIHLPRMALCLPRRLPFIAIRFE